MRRNAPFEPSAQRTSDYPTILESPPAIESDPPSGTPLVLLQGWRVQQKQPPPAESATQPDPDTETEASPDPEGRPAPSSSLISDTNETRSEENTDQSDAVLQPQDIISARELARFGAEAESPDLHAASGDGAARFRRRVLTAARLLVFVLLPATLTGWYFFGIASQLYMAEARFVIQAPFIPAAGSGSQQTAQDASTGAASAGAALSDFLRSRPAMRQLEAEHGFRAHFQQEHVDPIRRLPPDAGDDISFQSYRRHVQIEHDPVTGIVTIRAWALSAEDSSRFIEGLVHLARAQLEAMGADVRAEVLGSARDHLDEIQHDLIVARQRQAELERALAVAENADRAVGQLDARLRPSRAILQAARGDLAEPHPFEVWEDAWSTQLDAMSAPRPDPSSATLPEDAELQRQLVAAQTDVETHLLLRAQALAQIEQLQGDIARQAAALIVVAASSTTDRPDYPRKAEYTAGAFLGFLGLFVVVSLTSAALRKRASS